MAPIIRSLILTGMAACSFAQSRYWLPPQTTESGVQAWSGALIDATRTDCGPEVSHAVAAGTCPVSMRTKDFGLKLRDGKFVKLDEGGNAKALDALRRSRKASKIVFEYWKSGKASQVVKAQVTGTLTSDTLNVDSIKIE
jgi:hypothetical protein